MKKDFISIIIVNFQTKELIDFVINMINKYTLHPHEIIIIDNGSTDGSVELLEKKSKNQKNLKLINNKTKLTGSSSHGEGLDIGLKKAKGNYILTLDSDAFPVKKEWLKKLINIYKKDKKTGIIGINQNKNYVHPSCLFIKKNILLKYNLSFQPTKNYDTGVYLSHFLKKKGYKIKLLYKTNEKINFGKIYGNLVCHLWAGTFIKTNPKYLKKYSIKGISNKSSYKTKLNFQKNLIKNTMEYYLKK